MKEFLSYFTENTTICDAADAESLLVRLYEKLNAEEQEKVRKKILDGAPKKYCFSKQKPCQPLMKW